MQSAAVRKACFFALLTGLPGSVAYGQQPSCNPRANVRTRITAANVPNAFTCYMEMTRGRGVRYGTGFLIHPRVLLSAGHNFAWYPSGTVSQVKVYFGSIDKQNFLVGKTIKLQDAKNKFFLPGYWKKGTINRDYSLIILPDSAIYKKVGGCFKLLNPAALSQVKSLSITGSPGDKPLFEMWTSSTGNFSAQPGATALVYDLRTEVRNSGSPVWTKVGNDYYVLGVHSRSWGNCNAAVLLTDDVLQQIQRWCSTQGITLSR